MHTSGFLPAELNCRRATDFIGTYKKPMHSLKHKQIGYRS